MSSETQRAEALNDRFVTKKLGEHEGDIKFLRHEIAGLHGEMRELNIKLDLLVKLCTPTRTYADVGIPNHMMRDML